MGLRGRPPEKFADLRQFVYDWPAWTDDHNVEWTEHLSRLRRCGTRWLIYLCNLPTVDVVLNEKAISGSNSPLPESNSEVRIIAFARRKYQPDAPTLKYILDDELNALSTTLRDVLQGMATGQSHILMIQTPRLRIVSGRYWWSTRVDAAATSDRLKTALRSVRRQGMLAEKRPWVLCPICGCASPVYGNQKTCDRCIELFTARQRDRRIAETKGADPVDLVYSSPPPDRFGHRLAREFTEPLRFQQQNARLGMVSVVFRGDVDRSMMAGSIEANAVLRALTSAVSRT